MPLPLSGQEWPPRALAPITAKLAEFDAWYVGDPDRLSHVYANSIGFATTTRQQVDRAAQYRGGVAGVVARMWWGRPVGDLTQRTRDDKLHVPVAGDLCQASADLLFAEPPTITVEDKNGQAEIDGALDQGLITTLAEGAEVGAALGDVYLRASWDDQLADRSFITTVHADAALPEFRWGHLTAVTFWWVVSRNDNVVIRHLERHELENKIGVIYHGLYQGTAEALGRQIPLTEHASTAGIVVDELARITTDTPGLAVARARNRGPQRRWRNDPVGSQLGRSDLDGVEGLMDKLDMVYSSWMRDVRLAKSRLLVPGFMLDSTGPGQGAFFDDDMDVFTRLNTPPREDGNNDITPQQFEIRVAQHADTCQRLVEDILRTAGYSRQTFGEGQEIVAKTATEITSKDRRSALTRDRKIRGMAPAVAAILEKKLAIDSVKFHAGTQRDAEVTVQFVDATQTDQLTLAQTAMALFTAQSASTETRVRLNHPDWDETQIGDEVTAITSEFTVAVPDPTGFAPAADPNGDPAAAPVPPDPAAAAVDSTGAGKP